ncbi:hypothetical protein TrLO_g8610 [Triparma laevis f. longispina]|uniref:SSD domain-containing protein n=1 Tax=Triparma laevis f. longispina TaxID=1714387 RepID=A0A9W7B1J3_9STRA|nr:hypothetical protein TrLO_g8610 [Triparma laevis f. longispina]
MADVAPHPGDFVVQPTNTEEEVDLDEMPENKFMFGGARNSVQMMKDDIPITALELSKKPNHNVPHFIQSYANFVVRKPRLCLFISVVFMLAFSAIGFIVRDDLPDFKKADKGFDARGTDISGAQRTFKNMMDADICGGDLTYNPSGVAVNPDTWQPCNEEDDDRRLMEVEGEEGLSEAEVDYNEMQGRMLSGSTVNDTTCSYSRPYMLTNQWAPLVYAFEADGDDLFDTATVKAICQFSKDMSQQFYGFMAELNWATGESCHDRDLGFNIAYYYNKECAEITDEDVSNFKALLLSCAPAYESDKLRLCDFNVANCKDNGAAESPPVPRECWRENIVFDTLNAIVDKDFARNNGKVKYTTSIPAYTGWSDELFSDIHLELYNKAGSDYGSAKLTGYKTGDKFDVFTKQLILDNAFSGGAFFIVFCILWLHTSSGFIATFGFLQILLNLGVGYGIYMGVMFLPFFPFLNLVGIFVVVGIGADDIFVFMDCWKQTVKEFGEDATYEERLGFVLYRACGSMLITSLTTASAFCANAFSLITSLKCFGVYCAIVVVVDFFLMLSYIPALVIIYERYIKASPCCCLCCKCCTFCQIPSDPNEIRPMEKWFRDFFGPKVVVKFKYVWIGVFFVLAGFMGFKATQLQRPTSSDFQLFKPDHPMEMWDLVIKDHINLYAEGDDNSGMNIDFIFGAEGKDNGNTWDPNDDGHTVYLDNFDITSVKNQEGLANWCEHFRSKSYYVDPCVENPSWDNCRVEGEVCPMFLLKKYVETPCADTTDDPSGGCFGDECVNMLASMPARTTCCGLTFPISDAATLTTCIKDLTTTTVAGFGNTPGFWFGADGELKAMNYRLATPIRGQAPYEELDTFYTSLMEDMKTAKATLEGPWVSSVFVRTRLDFFDLQRSLGLGAYQSAGMSFAFAFCVLIFMTRNILLTILSLITIICIVCCVVGVLVLDGWELNIMESVIISVAVGMAVDFVAHYSHTYLHSPVKDDRDIAVINTLKTMGVSVLTGAITTFIAGAFMIFAQTLFFYQFGFFMMCTMGFAWVYSNFMLLPLMAVIGPVEKSGGGGRNKVVQVE